MNGQFPSAYPANRPSAAPVSLTQDKYQPVLPQPYRRDGTAQGAALMADEKTERGRAIDLALTQIEKQFGKGSIMKLDSKGAVVPISVISTGAISFDAALGVGGFP